MNTNFNQGFTFNDFADGTENEESNYDIIDRIDLHKESIFEQGCHFLTNIK